MEIRAVSIGEEYVGRILWGHIGKGIKERILEAKEQYYKGSVITHTERHC